MRLFTAYAGDYIKRTIKNYQRVQDDRKYGNPTELESDGLDIIKQDIEDLEVMTVGMLQYLEETDITHEDILAKVNEAELMNWEDNEKVDVCPECGNTIQSANAFIRKCLYCGYKKITNPYEEAEKK